MKLTYDEHKRAKTLEARGLDFADASDIFAGHHFNLLDDRNDYGEERYITVGTLKGRMVIVVWTPRGEARRIISMRKANEREQEKYRHRLD
ncbi:BrnT family toxin [Billgrantia desiderata]|uniref:BrnT family toxin n=1 Tax=Billgrantia desiderata TaxID=52021 RepID=UPI001F219F64|nr:BrnT family toxin [Halomonas desiderata]MCE8014339.1 BrnT family toxin [Halomonas desiderata]